MLDTERLVLPLRKQSFVAFKNLHSVFQKVFNPLDHDGGFFAFNKSDGRFPPLAPKIEYSHKTGPGHTDIMKMSEKVGGMNEKGDETNEQNVSYDTSTLWGLRRCA